ncbi:uncharacterized protein LOC135688827 [Rhopilema esculentum]|uniref:uncharacterized protein LOC135688827 n=1 Tax=Rhopilema esculentum TaxID=499914 RepID=UPI0031D5E437|eukprot:gene7768-13612_t
MEQIIKFSSFVILFQLVLQMSSCNAESLAGLFSTMKTTPLAHSCADAAQLGMYDNGFYTLHDTNDKKYTAYCDFTSEPGFAWTLIFSFSRHIVRTEPSQILKRKSIGDNAPVNQDSPNWSAFRFGQARTESLREVSSHFRFTCSEDGPFIAIANQNDYLRANFSSIDPLTLNVGHEKCAPVEFVSVRNVSCADCVVSFSQRKNIWSLHVDAWLAQNKCGMAKINDEAVHSEDIFGFYDQFNPKFTCTKHDWSTTQLWFGSRLYSEDH